MHGLKEYEKDHGHQMNDPDEQAQSFNKYDAQPESLARASAHKLVVA